MAERKIIFRFSPVYLRFIAGFSVALCARARRTRTGWGRLGLPYRKVAGIVGAGPAVLEIKFGLRTPARFSAALAMLGLLITILGALGMLALERCGREIAV